MKKILAIALALCLTLSLAVTAIASNNSPSLSPELPPVENVDPNNGVSGGSEVVSKNSYSATSEDGTPVVIAVGDITGGIEASALAKEVGSDAVAKVWKVTPIAGANGKGTLNLYAGSDIDKSLSYEVWQDDAWEPVEGATVKFNGDRVLITMDLSSLKTYPVIALVKSDKVTVSTPSDTTEQQGDDEGDDTVDLGDTEEPAKEENPKTGLALAVVPMAVAAAAIVVSKRR